MISCERGDYEIIIRNNYVSNSEASGIFFMMFKKNIFGALIGALIKLMTIKKVKRLIQSQGVSSRGRKSGCCIT